MTFDISVIIPTYNRAPILKKCLEALDRQTFPANRFEVIVVDDGSTDNTTDVCLGSTHKYLLQYLHQENAGCGSARRAGVEVAAGDYCLFINDDSILDIGCVAEHKELHTFYNSKTAILGWFNYSEFLARHRALTYWLANNPFTMIHPKWTGGIYTHCSMFGCANISIKRTEVINVGSFDERFKVMEDIELGHRLLHNYCSIVYHPSAIAIHDHLNFTIADLVKRAHMYGKFLVALYAKHPGIERTSKSPIESFAVSLDKNITRGMVPFLQQFNGSINRLHSYLEMFDRIDFSEYFNTKKYPEFAAELIQRDFGQFVPIVYFYNLFTSFLKFYKEPVR